ncbi:hypothetical protein SEPCBS119000_004566 [Sporothrix epigloea]|uniref:F-box domain-containing protein n=1 Tax=Sporothrix epigloea TaxID=1892477 RepID=A0ABP0DVQ0_9PEZI
MVLVQAKPSPVPGPDLLSRLPVELLLRITHHLKTTELCAVRLCSRSLESALRHSFVLEFFQRKQFMLTDFSLQTLLAIARHPVMSQALRHVSISLDELSGLGLYCPQSRNAMECMALHVQQETLFMSGRAQQLLAAAFSLLPNLEIVQLRDTTSRTRYRDGSHAPWRSYGLRCTQDVLGKIDRRFQFQNENPEISSIAFSIVMTALAVSNARPESIEVKMHSKWAGLKYFAFDLSPVPRLGLPGVSAENDDGNKLAVLAALRKLHLKLQFVVNPHKASHLESDDSPLDGKSGRAATECIPLHVWLAHCPNVQWFRLNLHKESRNHNDVFLRRLGSPLPAAYPLPAGSKASRNITMPFASHLRRFDLGVACCRRDVLLKLLNCFPALEHLSLFRFSLIRDKKTADTPYNIWNKFFDELATSTLGLQLKEMSLRRLSVAIYSYTQPYMLKPYIVTFTEDEVDDIHFKAEDGKPMASWLQDIHMGVLLQEWPGGYIINENDDDDAPGTPESENASYDRYMSEDLYCSSYATEDLELMEERMKERRDKEDNESCK